MTILKMLNNIFLRNKILYLSGIFLIVFSILLGCVFPHLSFLMLLLAFCGLCTIIYGLLLFFEKTPNAILAKTAKTLRFIALFLIAVYFVSNLFIQSKIFSAAKQQPVDAKCIIVLGCGLNGDKPTLALKYRLDKAIDYLDSHPNTIAVLSGGQGKGELIPEAHAMKKYMINHGVDAKKLIIEDKSQDTTQNIFFSKQLVDFNTSIAVVTNDFHIYRSMLIMKKAGFTDIYALPAKTPNKPFLRLSLHLREYFSIILEYLNL